MATSLFYVLFLLGFIFTGQLGEACEYLYSTDVTQSLDSHPEYGTDNYQTDYTECWTIEAPTDKVVKLWTEHMDIESIPGCVFDSLRVFDGSSNAVTQDVRTCGTGGINGYFTSGNVAFVEFISDSVNVGEGFRLNYVTTDGPSCTYLYAEENEQTFDSHAGASVSEYNPSESMCWVIEAPSEKAVHLQSQYFELEDYCLSDRVQLHDGPSRSDPVMLITCGSDGIQDFRSSGQQVYVSFRSDYQYQANGFIIAYKSVDVDQSSGSGSGSGSGSDSGSGSGSDYEYLNDGLGAGIIGAIVIACVVAVMVIAGITIGVCYIVQKKGKVGTANTTSTGQQRRFTTTNSTMGTQQFSSGQTYSSFGTQQYSSGQNYSSGGPQQYSSGQNYSSMNNYGGYSNEAFAPTTQQTSQYGNPQGSAFTY